MFFLERRLICFSCLSPKRILRAWKQVQVEFLRQGSSKQTSRISYIFPLGSFREGVNNFVRAQNLPRKSILGLPDGPEYVFLRMKRDPLIFTYKAFSQTVPEASSRRSRTLPDIPRRCQTLPDLPDAPRRAQTLPDDARRLTEFPYAPRRSQVLPNIPRRFQMLPDVPSRCQTSQRLPQARRHASVLPDDSRYS